MQILWRCLKYIERSKRTHICQSASLSFQGLLPKYHSIHRHIKPLLKYQLLKGLHSNLQRKRHDGGLCLKRLRQIRHALRTISPSLHVDFKRSDIVVMQDPSWDDIIRAHHLNIGIWWIPCSIQRMCLATWLMQRKYLQWQSKLDNTSRFECVDGRLAKVHNYQQQYLHWQDSNPLHRSHLHWQLRSKLPW